MEQLKEETHVRHHFQTAYCSLEKDPLRRVHYQFLRDMRALLVEWKFSSTTLPDAIGGDQVIMNIYELVASETHCQRIRDRWRGASKRREKGLQSSTRQQQKRFNITNQSTWIFETEPVFGLIPGQEYNELNMLKNVTYMRRKDWY